MLNINIILWKGNAQGHKEKEYYHQEGAQFHKNILKVPKHIRLCQ